MKKISIIALLFLASCASKELEIPAEQVDTTHPAKMTVTAEIVEDYSDDYNIFLQLNFRSRDGKWIRIDSAELDMSNSDNQPYNIIVGKDLTAWAEAKAEEKKIEAQNQKAGALGVGIAGGAMAILGLITQDKNLALAGTAMYGGAAGYSLYTDMKGNKNAAQGVRQVPDTHLYAPFAVPSMSLVKRWVLINLPSGNITKVAKLRMKTVEGETLNYKISLAK